MRNPLRIGIIAAVCIAISPHASACITCNRQVQAAIFDSQFYPNLLAMLAPFLVLAAIVAGLAWLGNNRRTGGADGGTESGLPLATAATVLGIGLGGFADGIVLHQILQWHEMLSNKLPPDNLVAKSVNMFWDGIFHAFCLLVVVAGVLLLWKAARNRGAAMSGTLLAGGLLGGWGIFNIVEGILDHQVLRLHNVREITPNVAVWNFGFLGFSVVLMGLGWVLVRKGWKPQRH